ncbi:hypothetical protein [Xenorhabdus sp. KK7.4]|uniref:hypothetical protein n=1 Tax=Xenorhabdus sp. KK7.4 TaxID=1851572 RepID=UPI0012903BFD|nr:hypothetical protein [Xenorhabdus sp. KK7.4]
MRYICALLEADIPGHLTLRLRMKVSRCDSSPATHTTKQNRLCLTSNDTVFTGTTFIHIVYSSRSASRILRGVTCVEAQRLPSDAAKRQTSIAHPVWFYDRFEPRITQ